MAQTKGDISFYGNAYSTRTPLPNGHGVPSTASGLESANVSIALHGPEHKNSILTVK